jgi:hypothetical protein
MATMTATEQSVDQPAPENSQPSLKKPSNGLGIAALVVGLVGLVLSMIPLVGLFGGFVAFVGLVLGIVALFLKGKSKGTAIAGTIVSAVALILSLVMSAVYAAAFVAAVEENLPDTPSVIAEDGEAAPAEEAAEDDAVGTRANPAPLGTTITIDGGDGADWEITPVSSDLDFTDEVKAANEFNTDPEAGNQYAMLNVNVKYVGPDSGETYELAFTYVSADGREYDGSFVSMDGQLSEVGELFAPGEAEGTVIIEIPTEGAADGVWGVEYIFGDPFFFAAE